MGQELFFKWMNRLDFGVNHQGHCGHLTRRLAVPSLRTCKRLTTLFRRFPRALQRGDGTETRRERLPLYSPPPSCLLNQSLSHFVFSSPSPLLASDHFASPSPSAVLVSRRCLINLVYPCWVSPTPSHVCLPLPLDENAKRGVNCLVCGVSVACGPPSFMLQATRRR